MPTHQTGAGSHITSCIAKPPRLSSRRGPTAAAAGSSARDWSPRGIRIDYTATDGRIRIFYRRTGAKETLRAPNGSSPAWSPDGRTIAYVERSGAIRLMRPDASRQHTLPARATAVTWSPDGRWLAYDHGGDIVVSHPDGSARRTIPVTARGLQADYRISWQAQPRA